MCYEHRDGRATFSRRRERVSSALRIGPFSRLREKVGMRVLPKSVA
jgi:hypothetical protein